MFTLIRFYIMEYSPVLKIVDTQWVRGFHGNPLLLETSFSIHLCLLIYSIIYFCLTNKTVFENICGKGVKSKCFLKI